jgi:hypothetical protein
MPSNATITQSVRRGTGVQALWEVWILHHELLAGPEYLPSASSPPVCLYAQCDSDRGTAMSQGPGAPCVPRETEYAT